MPRESRHITTPLGRVRAYYGLTQPELAQYLGITLSLANHLEAGRRAPSALVLERLSPLAAHMLPEAADVPLPTAPPAGRPARPWPFAKAPRRLPARGVQPALATAPAARAGPQGGAQALPGLRAALPPAEADAPPPTASLEARREAIRLRYVREFLEVQATALDPEALSRWHLLHLRAEALEAEAAALGVLLGQG
jgi:transcriptional regulator with XRE-family HTH domain